MYDVSEVLFTAIEGLIFIIAYAILSNRKEFLHKNYIKVVIFSLIYTFYTYWITFFLPTGVHTVFVVFFTIIILKYIFNATMLKSMIKVFSILIGISLIESLVLVFAFIILDIPINSLMNNNQYIFVLSLIAKIIEAGTVFFIYKRNISIPWLQDNSKTQSLYKDSLIIIANFIFLTVLINIAVISKSLNLVAYSIFSFMVYIILILFLFFAFREGSRLEIIHYANETKKENIKQLIEFNEMVAKERHEYKNHLNTIYGLCTLNKQDLSEKIKHYISSYANNSTTQNLGISSGNDFVDAIINVKYNNALKKGIEVTVNFEEPLSSANIDEDVAVTIISNIIENAFESITNSQQEKKYVKLETYIQNKFYYISISNNGPMIPDSDKKKIFSAGYSTKDNPSNTRGFGLSIVQTQLEKSGGKIFLNSNEEVTEFLIALHVNEQQAVI